MQADNTTGMDVSVIIPTYGRAAKIAACVRALAGQRVQGAYEVLVGIDGHDEGLACAVDRAWREAGGRADGLHVSQGAHAGPAQVRNRLLAQARGRYVLLLNDDVIPQEGLIEAHRAAQASRERPAMVLGAAPWVVHKPDRVFDRLVRETSMIFFYDQMTGAKAADPEHDWGFRHAWTLNLSIPLETLREAGGFTSSLSRPVFEDLEMAYRVHQRFGAPVLYRPEAIVRHDHRMEPLDYLRREYVLGHAAAELARVNPACAGAVFGRDLASAEEAAFTRACNERERRGAAGILASFLELAARPASALDGPGDQAWTRVAYQHHLPLKRWIWRRGLLDAHAGREADPVLALGELG